MRDSLLLLSNFIKKPKEVGAIAPSSKFLTTEIINSIDFKNSKNIVEFGPGLGTFTKFILKSAAQNAKIICFEVNKKFCKYMIKSIIDKRITVINSGAENIRENLKKYNIKKVDCVVSSLPFLNFTNLKRIKIIEEVKNSLSHKGRLVLFQYTNGLSELLKQHFRKVEIKFVPFNLPPSFVYICEM